MSEGAAKPGRPALLVNTVELMRVAGSRKHVSDIATAGDLGAEHAAIAGAIAVEVDLESTVDDIGLPRAPGPVTEAAHEAFKRRVARELAAPAPA